MESEAVVLLKVQMLVYTMLVFWPLSVMLLLLCELSPNRLMA